MPFRKVLNGILFILRTGCHWNAVPSVFGPVSTCHRRFQEWIGAGLLEELVKAMLRLYDELRGIDWTWLDCLGREDPLCPAWRRSDGTDPTDLGKCGTKRHLLIEGRDVPLSVHLSAANRHDLKSLTDLIGDGTLLAEDANELLDELGYTGHTKRRGEEENEPGVGEPVHPARR